MYKTILNTDGMINVLSRHTGAPSVTRRVCMDRLSYVLFLILACALIGVHAADYYLQTSDTKIGRSPDIIGLGTCLLLSNAVNLVFCAAVSLSLSLVALPLLSGCPCEQLPWLGQRRFLAGL